MSGAIRLRFEVDGYQELVKAARAIGESDLPYLRHALLASGSLVAQSARGFAKGGIGSRISAPALNNSKTSPYAKFDVRHPGSRSMEFGRKNYWRGYRIVGRRRSGGTKTAHSPGQKARPYIGILNADAAVGATQSRVKALLAEAVSNEWDRLGSGS